MDLDQVEYEEFINSLEDFVPTIPDEVITYYLNKTGFECSDNRIKRLISLATQKFISDVANDSLQFCKIRQQAPTREKVKKEKSLVLTMDDLSQSLRDYGINIRKPEYFAENIPPQQLQQQNLLNAKEAKEKEAKEAKEKEAKEAKEKEAKEKEGKDGSTTTTTTTTTGTSTDKSKEKETKDSTAKDSTNKDKANGAASSKPKSKPKATPKE